MIKPATLICDICGKEMEKSDRRHSGVNFHSEYVIKYLMFDDDHIRRKYSKERLDICGDCFDELKKQIRLKLQQNER